MLNNLFVESMRKVASRQRHAFAKTFPRSLSPRLTFPICKLKVPPRKCNSCRPWVGFGDDVYSCRQNSCRRGDLQPTKARWTCWKCVVPTYFVNGCFCPCFWVVDPIFQDILKHPKLAKPMAQSTKEALAWTVIPGTGICGSTGGFGTC